MVEINTAKGRVEITGPLSKEEIQSMEIDDTLNNFRNPPRQQEALEIVAGHSEGLVHIARHENTIIGYVMFHSPSSYSRWNRHPRLLELGAIEVSKNWKKMGVASILLKESFRLSPELEDYIVITTEFYWHWDLENSRLSVWQYQRMLKKLFGSAGFKKRHTDDPEILEHPANMLMVRFGKNITENQIKVFEDLTYQESILM